jgi:hypothetical protein
MKKLLLIATALIGLLAACRNPAGSGTLMGSFTVAVP